MLHFRDPVTRLGRYELIQPLGHGGMGVVWKARLAGPVPTFVALKRLHPLSDISHELRETLLHEAHTLAQIRSPHVVRLIEVFEEEATPCLVMEWVDGAPLSQLQKSGPLALGVALRIAADVCTGLHAVHECQDAYGAPLGLVHRDVSPQNIMVEESGVSKLIDFGIAKAVLATSGAQTTQLKGKLHYMSREQAGKEPLDRRTDIFSLGIVLYEMLTGVHPFPIESDLSLMMALSSKQSPAPMPASIPQTVQSIVKRALMHNRESRWPTALAMKQELEACMQDCGVYIDSLQLREALRAQLAAAREAQAAHLPTLVTPSPFLEPVPPALLPLPALGSPLAMDSETPPPALPEVKDTPRKPARLIGVGLACLLGTVGVAVALKPSTKERIATPRHATQGSVRMLEPVPAQGVGSIPVVPTRSSTTSTVPSIKGHNAVHVLPSVPTSTASTEKPAPSANPEPTAKPSPAPNCDPPWTIDAAGHKRYRPECP